MSWTTEDGLHEGYPAHILRDGREATGSRCDGLILDDGSLANWDQLLGWEACCTCGWRGPLYRRRDNAQDANEVILSPDGRTAEDAIRAAWITHHPS